MRSVNREGVEDASRNVKTYRYFAFATEMHFFHSRKKLTPLKKFKKISWGCIKGHIKKQGASSYT